MARFFQKKGGKWLGFGQKKGGKWLVTIFEPFAPQGIEGNFFS